MDEILGATALIYLWTRDGRMPVCQVTEDYIAGQLEAITKDDISLIFSDNARADMARRIIQRHQA